MLLGVSSESCDSTPSLHASGRPPSSRSTVNAWFGTHVPTPPSVSGGGKTTCAASLPLFTGTRIDAPTML